MKKKFDKLTSEIAHVYRATSQAKRALEEPYSDGAGTADDTK